MKYMGSKNRIAKYILPIILKDRKPDQYYVEPFVGGANIIDKVKGLRIGNELNKYVYALLAEMEKGWFPEMENISKEQWNDIKNNKNKYPDHIVGFVGISLSFGAVWFCSYAKDKNGKRNYFEESKRNIKKQSEKIKGVEFYNFSYEKLQIPPNSIIYCDPPYKGTDKYRGFEQIDHDKFWQWCRKKTTEGHSVFISELSAPEDFQVVWKMDRKSSSAELSSKTITEKLFIYNPFQNDLDF
jgi:DNA adenine methylase